MGKALLYIGIDTGVNTGVAVWNSKEKRLIVCATMKIHQAMSYVATLQSEVGDIEVRIEDPRLRTWYGTERQSREAERKRLQGVGSVKRDATIWEDYLTDLKVRFRMIHPKNNMTKITSEYFKSITGWTGRTNEHSRDAAMLVVGM